MIRRMVSCLIVGLALALCLLAGAAMGDIQCLESDELAAKLAREYHEQQVGAGLVTDTRLLQLFASPEGTWTAVVTTAEGKSCILAFGTGWVAMAPKTGAPA